MSSAASVPVRPEASPPPLSGLTGIRGLAAGAVVLDHLGPDLIGAIPPLTLLSPWFHGGFLGVEVFFVLSGFIIAYNYSTRFVHFSFREYRRFLELRVARIYPVHLFTLGVISGLALVAVLAHVRLNVGNNYSVKNFLGNLVLIQGLPGFVGFNGPAWSITWEFLAYLAFPALAVWIGRLRSARAGGVAAAGVLLLGTGAMLVVLPSVGGSSVASVMMFLRIATEFTGGALLYTCWRSIAPVRRITGRWDLVITLSAALVLSVILATGGHASALASVPLIALFVLACASSSGPLGRFLGSRGMLWAGRVSYSLYMTHFTVILVLHKLLPSDRVGAYGPVGAVCYVVLILGGVVGVAAATYYTVEEPGRRLIRRIVGREKKAVVDPSEERSP